MNTPSSLHPPPSILLSFAPLHPPSHMHPLRYRETSAQDDARKHWKAAKHNYNKTFSENTEIRWKISWQELPGKSNEWRKEKNIEEI